MGKGEALGSDGMFFEIFSKIEDAFWGLWEGKIVN